MKTWVFSRDNLETEIQHWVNKQIETGHPKAPANAAFVGEAIKDFLENATSLHRSYPEPNTNTVRSTKSSGESSRVENKQVETPVSNWENTEINGMSPADMLKVWEQSK